jgi:steroid 5-alpha reductase family enzyme
MGGIVEAVPFEIVWLFGLALLLSAGGFYRVVYFVSLGYAFSITAQAAYSAIVFRGHLDLWVGLQCLGLAIYGLRLGSYLISRERSPAYRRELEDAQQRSAGLGVGKKALIWVGVAVLYVLMFSSCLWNLEALRSSSGSISLAALPVGVAIMFVGLALEALADHQKSVYKKANPDRFCDVGLYRMVRCPNYFGEIVVWVGQFVAGLSAYSHWTHWAASSVGFVCIVLIMMGSTKRLEAKQEERYGDREDYQKYIKSVPVLFPLVPVYSLKKVKVYLE